MPIAPSPAQTAASRRNGARSSGPVTPEGKAKSSRNALRHGLAGVFALLPGEDRAAYDALLHGYLARFAPADAAERAWVEEMAHVVWRRQRLRALVVRAHLALDGAAAPGTVEQALPSLATLARYEARLERALRLAREEFDRLAAHRLDTPAEMTATQLRWLADRVDALDLDPANDHAPADTHGPDGNESADTADASRTAHSRSGSTNEPEPAPQAPARWRCPAEDPSELQDARIVQPEPLAQGCAA